MRIAVFYTGALRTVEKTIRFFQRNVLLGSHVHIFACVQNDTAKSNEEWEAWFRDKMGPNLVSLVWFDMAHLQEWTVMREKNLAMTQIPANWKDYLRNSGSVIEYIQLFLAYQQMFRHEHGNGFQYDYIIRVRPDNLFAKPVDFHWLSWTEEEIQSRLTALRYAMELNGMEMTPENVLQSFMTTLLSNELLGNLKTICGEYIPSKHAAVPVTAANYRHYLQHGSYLLAFRVNNLYIVRRDLFYLIPSVASMYGLIPTPKPDAYWFNAENQFQSACHYAGITIHNYETALEGGSLYEYDEQKYFDGEGEILHPSMVYCMVRH